MDISDTLSYLSYTNEKDIKAHEPLYQEGADTTYQGLVRLTLLVEIEDYLVAKHIKSIQES